MQEVWKAIPGYEKEYEISTHGRIKSLDRVVPCKHGTRLVKGKLLKTYINRKGYLIVTLSKENKLKTYTVHQLVALTFIPNFIKGTEINHKDGNKSNPVLDNLEISNPSHNQLHAIATGLKAKVGKSKYHNVTYIKNPRAKKKWAASISYNGEKSFGWKTFMTEEEAARYVDKLLDEIGDTSRLRNF
ncbi:HNH homing endonuclease [Escherichia phage Pollock]|uniref:HNH homing endonuclease n=1 Tax=Escherichia phage Pollock TaxID=1540097 RepID=A0A0A0YQW4_9CAUD|nr:HNH endonuclease [Escherichia phage Pollock]AIX12391.1 HNH homing endonuclease [Escherichia phage Pollock]